MFYIPRRQEIPGEHTTPPRLAIYRLIRFINNYFPLYPLVVGSNKSCIWRQFLDRWITLSSSLGLSRITNEIGTWAGLGGYFQKNWVGVCGTLPETLTLFQTKICDFPYPIPDLIKNLIPYFRPA